MLRPPLPEGNVAISHRHRSCGNSSPSPRGRKFNGRNDYGMRYHENTPHPSDAGTEELTWYPMSFRETSVDESVRLSPTRQASCPREKTHAYLWNILLLLFTVKYLLLETGLLQEVLHCGGGARSYRSGCVRCLILHADTGSSCRSWVQGALHASCGCCPPGLPRPCLILDPFQTAPTLPVLFVSFPGVIIYSSLIYP